MKICMAGANGRMGRRILELAAADPDVEIGGVFDAPHFSGQELQVGTESNNTQTVTLGADAASETAKADVLIDFTFAEVCIANVRAAVENGKAAVVGTTGLSPEQVEELHALAQQQPIVYAPNMSVGVNLLFKLTQQVAQVLGLDYNIEIVEVHHNQKKDSPSGTAVRLAERAAQGLGLEYPKDAVFGREGLVGARPVKELGVHTVSFFGKGERVELTHKASSRDTFAAGSLVAAKFAAKAKPGLYDMQDVLGLK
jgi:4-hydroxy-tetrahydrodipicolinate reductase